MTDRIEIDALDAHALVKVLELVNEIPRALQDSEAWIDQPIVIKSELRQGLNGTIEMNDSGESYSYYPSLPTDEEDLA